jgi:hypothetical protein
MVQVFTSSWLTAVRLAVFQRYFVHPATYGTLQPVNSKALAEELNRTNISMSYRSHALS